MLRPYSSNNSNKKAWEGLGGPVSLDPYDFNGIDPTLDSCCQREIQSNRKYNSLMSTLTRHDVTQLAERRRRHLLSNLEFGSGCRCSYDPNADGGQYRALLQLREELAHADRMDKYHAADADDDDPVAHERCKVSSDEEDGDDEFDYLLDEDLPIDNDLEDRRRAELEFMLLNQEMALCHGFGAHRQMHPCRVLKAAGLGAAWNPPPAIVLHLLNEDSCISATLDLFLEKLALEYKGTKFLRSSGRSTLLMDADFAKKNLPSLNPSKDMPVLIAIREGTVVASSVRLEGLTEDDAIIPHAVRDWLDHANVLLHTLPSLDVLCRIRPEEDALLDNMRAEKHDLAPRYDCGIPTCCKPFYHEHVGVTNHVQDGRLVAQETVIGAEMPPRTQAPH